MFRVPTHLTDFDEISSSAEVKECVELYLHSPNNVKLSLIFNQAPRPEGVLVEWRYSSTHSLISALDGGEWSASHTSRFTPRVVLDAVVKIRIPSPRRESNPRIPIVQPIAQRYNY
jgi:hypothetical protein